MVLRDLTYGWFNEVTLNLAGGVWRGRTQPRLWMVQRGYTQSRCTVGLMRPHPTSLDGWFCEISPKPSCYLYLPVVMFWMDDPGIPPNLPDERMILIVMVWCYMAAHLSQQ